MPKDLRKWYTKKRWLAAFVFVFALAIFPSEDTTQVSPRVESAVQETQSFVESAVEVEEGTVEDEVNITPQPFVQTQSTSSWSKTITPALSNDNYYTNTDGYKVNSPAYAPSIPAGASAMCRDGTYSFSMNRRGTCSHHGGVATWY